MWYHLLQQRHGVFVDPALGLSEEGQEGLQKGPQPQHVRHRRRLARRQRLGRA
jgi:hypothetical protein